MNVWIVTYYCSECRLIVGAFSTLAKAQECAAKDRYHDITELEIDEDHSNLPGDAGKAIVVELQNEFP